MGQKWVGQIDLNTGLAQEGLVVLIAPKRTNGFRERWLAMAQEAAERVAEQRKLLGEEGLAVLFMLLAKLDFENTLLVNQAELGRKLGMHRQSVQQAIKKLMGVGVLLEGPKVGQNRSYRLNPEFGWKGSAKNHVEALDDHRMKRMKAAKITGVIENKDPEPDPK
jgi:biotin operon repressor